MEINFDYILDLSSPLTYKISLSIMVELFNGFSALFRLTLDKML